MNNKIDSATSKQSFYKPIIGKTNNVKMKSLNRCITTISFTAT